MTPNIKTKAPIIFAEIQKAKNILLHCHPNPDPDSVGSSLAMKLVLEQMGKKVTLIKGDSNIPKAFVFPGVETITQKNYFEIDIKDFDLFIILDSGSVDMISRRSKEYGKDSVVFPENLTTVVIDHHASNKGYGKINCVDTAYPASAQILYDLFKEMNIKIDHDIALNLFMGIYTDTGAFKYEYDCDMAETIKIASELALLAPDYRKTIFTMENSNSKEAIIFEGLAFSSLKTFCDGKIAITSVSFDEIEKNGITEDDLSSSEVVNTIKSIIGFDIAVSMVEKKKGSIKLSFRTRDKEKYDVSKLAVALGGGGHKGAAATNLNMTTKEAIDKVVETAQKLYNL
jgi:phosphoesterase RecJ-like protein